MARPCRAMKPFSHQPGVQVHAVPERVEPVVGDDEDERARLDPLEDLADELVAALVDPLDRVAVLRRAAPRRTSGAWDR